MIPLPFAASATMARSTTTRPRRRRTNLDMVKVDSQSGQLEKKIKAGKGASVRAKQGTLEEAEPVTAETPPEPEPLPEPEPEEPVLPHDERLAGIAVWAENQVLVAYSHDCTLRLFSTTEKSRPND